MTSSRDTVAPAAADARGVINRTHGILGRLACLAVIVLLLGQILVAWFAVTGFERALEPQLSHKAGAVGRAIANQIEFVVVDLGIPPDELVGVDPFLDGILADNTDIEYLIILDASSNVLFARGLSPETLERVLPGLRATDSENGSRPEVAGFINSVFPVVGDDRVAAVLHVGVSGTYMRERLSELVYEVITIIVVSLLVTLEFLMFLMSVRVSGPMERVETILGEGAQGMFGSQFVMRARDEIGDVVAALNRALRSLRQRYEDFRFEVREIKDAQIDKDIANRIQAASQQVDDRYRFSGGTELRLRNAMQIRIPLFVFMFAEELPRSFVPLFAARLSPTDAAISHELLFGLPITLFMLAGMLMVPVASGLAERFGTRRVFLAGIVPATVGYAGTFLAQGIYELVAWRMVSGVGYGIIFIAAQAWVADNTDMRYRAQGMTVFVGAAFAAAICGPSIGGILADRLGFETTFLISAGLAAISGMLIYAMLDGTARTRTAHRAAFGGKEIRTLLSDGRLFAITVFAAIPGKLILTGFLFYLVPIYLSELGYRLSVIGWMITLYGVSTLACTSFAARFADRSGRHAAVVAVGGVLAGLGCLASLAENAIGGPFNAVLVAILALGFGHALSLTSEIALVQNVARRRGDLHQASMISAYRLAERAGMVLGPIVAGTLATRFGYQGAIVGIGVILLVSTALYVIAMNPLRPASG
ncbi:MAG: MFS transporter, partial [Thiotrichales bacterium]|nr:MFS transporter [Thiotrichales bacterium]